MFKKMDNDNDGIVSIEELKAGFRNFGSQLAESEIQMFIEAVSMANFPLFLVAIKLSCCIINWPSKTVPSVYQLTNVN